MSPSAGAVATAIPKNPSAVPCSRGDQQPEIGRNSAQDRAQNKQCKATEVYALDSKTVGQKTGYWRANTQRQDVDAEHPLRVGQAGVEFAPQGREGDIDNRGVEKDHEEPEDYRDQHFPLRSK